MKTGRLEDVADVLKNLNEVQTEEPFVPREEDVRPGKYLLVSEVAIVKDSPSGSREAHPQVPGKSLAPMAAAAVTKH